MKNKVFYGEYSLAVWINLILTKNIELPDYQRFFVWDKDKVKKFISDLDNNTFVPPITIGQIVKNGEKHNYILDGQQRLTSILLAYLGIYPNIKRVKPQKDDEEEEEEEEILTEWTFRKLTTLGKKKNDILQNIKSGYKTINFVEYEKHLKFFKEHTIGFSYIVPQDLDNKVQQRFYSTIFRTINVEGVTLLDMEARRSFYFLDDTLTHFFEPTFVKDYMLEKIGERTPLDFVRYMALLSQYKKDERANNLTLGYTRRKLNQYYIDYIEEVIGIKNKDKFQSFEEIFSHKEHYERLGLLEKTLHQLEFPKSYGSIIDMDIHMFGLIYMIMIEGKEIDISRKDELKKAIRDMIDECKNEPKHPNNPAAKKFLRSRVSRSIEMYSSYEVLAKP